MSYGVTGTGVRLIVGIGTSDISNADMVTLVSNAESEIDRLLNTTFTPKRIAERHETPNSPSYVMLRRIPVTRVVNVQVGGTGGSWVDPNHTIIDNDTGKLLLTTAAAKSQFDDSSQDANIVDYYYGQMEDSTSETTLSAASGTGTSVTITVGSTVGIAANDYIRLVGSTDGNSETTKVVSVGNGSMMADMSWVHQTSSRVIKQQVPEDVKRLVEVTAGIMAARHMMGATYTFATSYSFPEYTVAKGVPYPHFEKVYDSLIKQREFLLNRLRPKSSVY